MYIVKTQPTFAAQALSSTALTNGVQTIYKVTITADATEDVSIASLNFNVASNFANAVTLTPYKLYVNGTDKTADGAFAGTRFTYTSNAKDAIIAAGTSKTFELKATVNGTLTTSDYVSVKLVEDNAVNHGAYAGVNDISTTTTAVTTKE